MFITGGETNYHHVFSQILSAFIRQRGNEGKSVAFFNEEWVVRRDGIFAGPKGIDPIGGILILRYLEHTHGPGPQGEWVPYRDFSEGRGFAPYIKAHIEDPMARAFTGRLSALVERIEALGGVPCPVESRPDASMVVPAFPAIPVLTLFWDRDEEFPASLQFLFDRTASLSLDMESLAVILHYIYLKTVGISPFPGEPQ